MTDTEEMDEANEKRAVGPSEASRMLGEWRERNGLTFEEAGKKLRCAHATVRRLERGESEPKVGMAVRIESTARISVYAWQRPA
jgi:transcriptional regulator with XRE-family HTH domain